ncbi:MAG TPA: hypothetical protein VK427_21190 [Kofleriaceae bacterium]|nr:hypothetical protein [Kofleriaceae bacterium]
MRTAVVIAALLLGCGAESAGGPCSLDEPNCGDGVCNLTTATGTGVCIDSDGDVDGDGLVNAKDFCHQGPGGAHDEDADLVGDDCDRCPIARPLATPDTDADEVDAPCDPEPTIAGDRIVVFEGFNAALPSTWKQAGGTWEQRGGEVIGTPTAAGTLATLVGPLPLVTTKLAVLGSYRVDRVEMGASTSFVGVTALDRRPAGVAAVSCGGQRAGSMDSLLLDTDVGASAKPFANLFDVASRYRVAQKQEGTTGACSMIADNEQGAVGQNTGGNAPTEAGVFTLGATTRFQYLLVVQRP